MKLALSSKILAIGIVGTGIFMSGYFLGMSKQNTRVDESSLPEGKNPIRPIVESNKMEKALNAMESRLANRFGRLETNFSSVRDEIMNLNQSIKDVAFPCSHTTQAEKLHGHVQGDVIAQRTANRSNDPSIHKTMELSKLVDPHSVQEMVHKLYTGETLERARAIKALIAVGSPQIKLEIHNFILSENEESELRRIAIEESDWQGRGDVLTTMVEQTSSIDVRAAVIYAAKNANLRDEERERFEQSLQTLFAQEQDDIPRAVILEYFADNQPEKFETFLSAVDVDNLPVELQDHIQFLKEGFSGNSR